MPDYPTRMSISATLRLSSSCSHPTCYLQDRDEIADDVIIAISPGTPKPLCESHRNLGTSPHSAIRHKPTSYGRIHTSAFSGHKSLISHSFCSLTPMVSAFCTTRCSISASCRANSPAFQLDVTVRAAFMPDSALEFLPIFSSSKYTKLSIFSGFLHS